MEPQTMVLPKKQKTESTNQEKLKVIPLGGLGEIGKNMTALEYGDNIIIIDCGLMFPKEEMLGVDLVIPQTKYLEENREKIRGIFITHGHLDHTGALPYILPKLRCPVYAAKLTVEMIKSRFKEFSIKNAEIKQIDPGQIFQLGIFKIETLALSHTIPDEMGLIIDTPVGRFVYIVDFKFDFQNIEERKVFQKLAEVGKSGVRCLFLDSTGAEVEGQSVSEVKVKESIESLVREAKGRVIVTSFSSNVSRIQSVFDAAKVSSRKVVISGRSMEQMVEIATKIGYLKIPQGLLVDIRRINSLPDSSVVILCTGSQGEEYAALIRMAAGDHRQIKIKSGDLIILSSSVVPGNERSVADTINNLFREGAEVIYGGEAAEIHASGHAKAEELKIMISLIKPECFIPIHGEYRHLFRHAQIAQSLGVDTNKIFVMDNGEIVEFSEKEAHLLKRRVPAGYVLVDGLGVGDVGNIVLRDRRAMAKDGILLAIMTVDVKTGRLLSSPDIISRGFIYMREREDLVHNIRTEAKNLLSKYNEHHRADWALIKTLIREDLGRFIYNETERRPMILPVIIEL